MKCPLQTMVTKFGDHFFVNLGTILLSVAWIPFPFPLLTLTQTTKTCLAAVCFQSPSSWQTCWENGEEEILSYFILVWQMWNDVITLTAFEAGTNWRPPDGVFCRLWKVGVKLTNYSRALTCRAESIVAIHLCFLRNLREDWFGKWVGGGLLY